MSERTNVRWVKPPAFLVAVAGLVGAIGIGMVAVGSQTIGVSTDEPGHVRRLNAYLETGLYVRVFEVRATPPGQIPAGAYVYGPVTSVIQHDFQRLYGSEPKWSAKTRANHYAIRHAVIAAMSIVGLFAAALTAWLILGDWRWGVVAGGALAALPLWTGHGMFNMKDVPVATGHTLITLALVLLGLSKPVTRHLAMLFSAVTLVVGTVLMLGTRPGAWPSLLASVVVLGVIVFRSRADQTRASLLRLAGVVGLSLVASYGVLAGVYPRIYGNLGRALYMSAFGSADYDGLGDHTPSNRGYVFEHVLIDLPLGLVALMAAGTAAAIILLAVQRRRSTQLDCLALVGSQAFALITAAVIFDSALYHGLRQLLFAIPALAILATVGLAALLTIPRKREVPPSRPAWPRRALAIAACFALVLPTAVQLALFPYQYSYVNVAAEQLGKGMDDDYFGTSFREYAYKEPQDVKVICPFQRFGGEVWGGDTDCRTRFAHTFSAYWRGRPTPNNPKHGEFYAILRGSRSTPPNCKLYREVERWRNLEKAVMSRMFVCHQPTTQEWFEGNMMEARRRQELGLPPDKGMLWPDWHPKGTPTPPRAKIAKD
ncbi:MAG TPA: hypothetical protein VM093_02370 [Aeromicrobium sp.]|nr:hypothetical protein [Aeromicrobium sp.]